MEERKRLDMQARSSRASRSGPLLLASFGLSFFSVLLLYILCGIAPFGDRMLIFCDAKDQYISFLAYFRQLLLGRQDAFYALEKTMGGGTAGLLAYYTASPFNLLLPLFPERALPLAFHLLVLLKLSLCGLTLALYFKGTGALTPWSLLFTFSYTLCGYNISYYWCLMWLDGVLLLPLVALGLERLFRQGKGAWLYLLALAAAIIANYYTGYMLCLFSVLYAACLVWCTGGRGRFPWKETGLFALSSLATGGCSAFLLIPALLSMRGGKTESFSALAGQYISDRLLPLAGRLFPRLLDAPQEQLARTGALLLAGAALLLVLCLAGLIWFFRSGRVSQRGKLLALLGILVLLTPLGRTVWVAQKLLVGSSSFYEMAGGEVNVYLGILPLVFLPGFFLLPSVGRREKTGALLMIMALVWSTRYYMADLAWHGFTEHVNFNYRYSFILSFVLLLPANRAAARLRELRPLHLLAGAALVLSMAAAAVLWGKPLAGRALYLGAAALGLLFAAALFPLTKEQAKGGVKACFAAALLAGHLLTLLWPACENILRFDAFMPTSYSEYTRYTDEARSAVSAVEQAGGDGLYRACLDGGINGPMQFGYNGLSHFSSTEQEQVVQFLRRLGLAWEQNYWASGMYGRSRAVDCLFGVKYSTQGSSAGETAETLPGTGVQIAPWALPLAFLADEGVLSAGLQTEDPFENVNAVFRSLCPEVGQEVFTPARSTELTASGLTGLPDRIYVPEEGAVYGELKCEVEIRSEEPLYLYIGGCEDHKAGIYLNGEYFTSCSELGEWRMICLGSFQPGETLELALRTEGDGLPGMSGDLRLCYENGEALAAYYEALTAEPAATAAKTDSRLVTDVPVSRGGQCLLYTIPLDSGWEVRVDGEKTEPEAGLGIFLTVPLEPGAHRVELTYTPPGFWLGVGISAGTLFCLLAALIISKKRRAQAGQTPACPD